MKINYDQPEVAERAIEALEFICSVQEGSLLTDADGNNVGVVPVPGGWVYVYADGNFHHSYHNPELYQEALNG